MRFLLIALLFPAFRLFANPGDTTHVITHSQVLMTTNPGTGSNGVKAWGIFPSASLQVRKVFVMMNYKCPSGMSCGAWDYIDQVVIRRRGSVNAASSNTEIVRFITPYGNTYNSAWKFGWHMDVTDYADMLRDSVEIEYIHTGYEGTNVGWSVTLDFNIIEGTPLASQTSFTQLWEGSFQYGNATSDIDLNLPAMNFTTDANCSFTKLRILHTGHGSDDNGCSEFCSKTRTVKFDGNVVNIRDRWRTCGNNALYPQGGTWVYDRGNWCPGSVIFPDVIMNSVSGNSSHSYDIDMQNYVGTGSLGNEVINAHLFQYAAPNNANDASIEEMTKPSKMYEYTRFNPICANPEILIRNNGSNTLTTADIKYGFQGALQTFTYTGNLAFGDTATVKLPNLSWTTATSGNFIACISTVNGQADQYTYDDTAKAVIALPPVNDSIFMVVLYTNNNPWENSYTITDAAGNIVHSRIGTSLAANTMYRDTIHFSPGCYSLKIYDTGGDGLSFWANTAQGSGQIKLKKMYTSATNFFKIFPADFGNFIFYDFIVNPNVTSISQAETEKPYFIVYPNPATDKINVVFDIQSNDAGSVKVMNVLGETLYEKNLKDIGDNRLSIDAQAFDKGVYFVRLVKNNKAYTRKVILTK